MNAHNKALLADLATLKDRLDIPAFLNKWSLSKFAAEVGVAEGIHAFHIRQHWKGLRLYLVDAWAHQPEDMYRDGANLTDDGHEVQLASCKSRLHGYEDTYEIVRGFSPGIASQFRDKYFDFVYIDANHSYAAAKADILAWMPKVKSGGILAGHDYVDPPNRTFGVKPAVDELIPADRRIIIPTPPGGHCSWATVIS